jgi:hypothetical protein
VKRSFESVLLCLLMARASAQAQEQPPNPTPEQPSPAAQTPGAGAGATATLAPPREVASTVNTGTGFSIEPFFWYTRNQPMLLRSGATNVNVHPGDFDYPNRPKRSIGGRVTIPVSPNGTLRASYFQTQSTGTTTASGNLNLLGQEITSGDFLATRYRIEGFKLSYDYLTYFWKRRSSEIRLKTLYEVQRISIANEIDDFQVDSTGALININPAEGTKTVFWPSFGLGLEHTLSRHFRWEARASGFALPHRAVLGDLEAAIALRLSHFEVLGGGRWLHFKTNPQSTQYNIGTLYGPYISVRYYWKKQ